MLNVPVFAGLGSPTLFSERTQSTALVDASTPEAQLLLEACHEIFRKEIAEMNGEDEGPFGIDLGDFEEVKTLLKPPMRYFKNAVIQNTTLALIQLLRYLAYNDLSSSTEQPLNLGVAGFCAGLIASTAVATSSGKLQFLARGQTCFTLALLLGIRCEQQKQKDIVSDPVNPDCPWSLIVDGITVTEAENLLVKHKKRQGSHIYISAINAENCITLSGRGDALRAFADKELQKCKVLPTSIYSSYHDGNTLINVKSQLMQDIVSRGLSFPSVSDLIIPIYSTKDGAHIRIVDSDAHSSLLERILDMILIYPVNWVSVQQNIFDMIEETGVVRDSSVNILNFGPGYGISKTRSQIPLNARIIDASASSRPHSSCHGPTSEEDIAIVGMAVDLPGAPDSAGLWKVLSEGMNTVTEIPTSRFRVEDFCRRDGMSPPNPKRSMGTQFGNFIDNPFKFDTAFFGISPREAKSIDPQQRVMLQTTLKALDDAGYVPDTTPSSMRKTFGCYMGNVNVDYLENLKDEMDVYYSPGTMRAFLSGRISYAFKFSGPSLTIDTACSGSMIAILQACRALIVGDCRAAVAGGVNVMTSPDMYLGLDRGHFLSPTGQCKPFDASADGYCRSEGCGVFVLKKMSDALIENDRILGVIKGIEANQSGNAHSITHPHAPTQEDLIQTLLFKTNIDPLRISVVEAHGTGTQAGDPNELASIRSALCKGRTQQNPLHITSIKANIGHTEAASGAASLAKLLLMLRHDKIPPLISLKNLNPKIAPLKLDGATIDREGASWPQGRGQPRLALLNNFGASGSNSALILQEHIKLPNPKSESFKERIIYPFSCSAKSQSALFMLRDSIISYLRNHLPELRLVDVCYTSTARRQIYQHQFSICASSIQDLINNLENAESVSVPAVLNPPTTTTFLFSGQGRQYLGMGQELYATSHIFRATVLECHQLLIESGFPGCLNTINPSDPSPTPSTDDLQLQAFQTSLFVLEVAIARLWLSWGVIPSVVTGHSIGEYAALVTAGVLDLADGLKIVAHRASLMMKLCQSGMTGMLAVNVGAAQLEEFIRASSVYEQVSIACYNSTQDCVVGGPVSTLQALKQDITNDLQRKSTMLKVPLAYHTKAMDPILAPLAEVAHQLKISAPKIAVASNVLGRVVSKGEHAFTPEYFVNHCRQPVAFAQGIEDLIAQQPRQLTSNSTWIEVGPHPTLLPMIRSKIQPTALNVASMREGTQPWTTLSQALSRLYLSSSKVEWRKVFEGYLKPRCVAFPVYPLGGADYYIEYPRENLKTNTDLPITSPKISTGYSFLSSLVDKPSVENDQTATWDTPIDILAEYIIGHVIYGYALCPASVYHETVLSALKYMAASSDFPFTNRTTNDSLSDITYPHPLLYNAGSRKIIRTSIKISTRLDEAMEFSISSYEQSAARTMTIHCKGLIKRRNETVINQQFTRLRPSLKRKKSSFTQELAGAPPQVFHASAMYEKIFARVVTYSDMYRAVRSIRVSDDSTEGFATAQIPPTLTQEKKTFAVNPIFGDVLLHVAGFLANLSVGNDEVCIGKAVKSMKVLTTDVDFGDVFEVHCSNAYIPEDDSIIADAQAVDLHGRVIAVFKGIQYTRIKLSKLDTLFRIASMTRSPQSRPEPESRQAQTNALRQDLVDVSPRKKVVSHSRVTGSLHTSQLPIQGVETIIAETCGVSPTTISADTDLEGLGIDSLMIFELDARLKELLGSDFQSSGLAACKTVSDVERLAGSTTEPKLDVPAPVIAAGAVTASDNCYRLSPLAIASIIAKICGAEQDSVTEDTALDTLGVDSLMVFELEVRLRDVAEVEFDVSELSSCKNVRDIVRLVSREHDSEQEKHGKNLDETNPEDNQPTNGTILRASLSDTSEDILTSASLSAQSVTPITPADNEALPSLTKDTQHALKLDQSPEVIQFESINLGSSAKAFPLFLIHDGSGLCVKYHKLLPLHRQVWGIHNPKFANEEMWEGPASMATTYATQIVSTNPGPIILAGWSFGGVIAFEIAKILLARDLPVVGIMLIDAPAPLNHQPLSPQIINFITKTTNNSLSGTAQNQPSSAETIRSLVCRQFRLNTALMQNLVSSPILSSASSPAILTHKTTQQKHPKVTLLRARSSFDATDLGAPSNKWLEDRRDPGSAVEGWEKILGKKGSVEVMDIGGDHFGVFDDKHIKSLSDTIKDVCSEMEQSFRQANTNGWGKGHGLW